MALMFHNTCVLIVVVGQGYFGNIDGTHLPESTPIGTFTSGARVGLGRLDI